MTHHLPLSTTLRDITLLREVLSGLYLIDCAKKYNITTQLVSSGIRSALNLLKEHTDFDLRVSTDHAYLMENKAQILKYLAEPLPKVPISYEAKRYLSETFGKYYVQKPEIIAAKWEAVRRSFSYQQRRAAQSIQQWLASEGFLVGDFVTGPMLAFSFDAIKGALNQLQVENSEHSFSVKSVQLSGPKTLIVDAEITEGNHRVTRRFFVELVP